MMSLMSLYRRPFYIKGVVVDLMGRDQATVVMETYTHLDRGAPLQTHHQLADDPLFSYDVVGSATVPRGPMRYTTGQYRETVLEDRSIDVWLTVRTRPNGLPIYEPECIATFNMVYQDKHIDIWVDNDRVHRDNDKPAIVVKQKQNGQLFPIMSIWSYKGHWYKCEIEPLWKNYKIVGPNSNPDLVIGIPPLVMNYEDHELCSFEMGGMRYRTAMGRYWDDEVLFRWKRDNDLNRSDDPNLYDVLFQSEFLPAQNQLNDWNHIGPKNADLTLYCPLLSLDRKSRGKAYDFKQSTPVVFLRP